MNNFEVTPEMITVWGNHFGAKSIDDVPGIIGSMNALSQGMGELPAALFDAEATRDMFAKLRSLYFSAQGKAEPAYSVIDEPVVAPVEAEVAPVVEEVAPVAEEAVEKTEEVSSQE